MPDSIKKIAAVFFVAMVILPTGCRQTDVDNWNALWGIKKPVAANTRRISVYQLAKRLGLKIAQATSCSAILTDQANVVTIVADPNGKVYVNGDTVRVSGPISPLSGSLFVPGSLANAIRPVMRSKALFAVSENSNASRNTIRPRWLGGDTVVVDAGHGGKDPGAIGVYKRGGKRIRLLEKTVNLHISGEVAKLLERRGVKVVMTRDDDSFIPLAKRVSTADNVGASLLLSLHADAARNKSAHGFTVYVGKKPSGKSLSAARKIARRLAATGAHSRGVKRHERNIRVINAPKGPSVLVEVGFLSNAKDVIKLDRRQYRLRLAKAIADGVMDFLEASR